MKNKKILLLFIFLFSLIVPQISWAVNISFGNPGTTGTATGLFEAILGGILNIIAVLGVLFIVIGGISYLIGASSSNENLIGTGKKIILGAILGLILGLSGPTLIQEIKTIFLDGDPLPTNLDEAPSLTDIATNTLSFLLSIIGIVAIISLVVNGILYLTTGGDSSRAEKIKTNIKFSILGFLIAGSALILVKQIVWFIEN